jgi:PhzF family phenazine biosynthesis protein
MKITVNLVKAFTKDKDQGNPAGVVRNANSLTSPQMLKIAQHFGFSESAFIQTSTAADYRVRFFSVLQEVDFCGHATVATFFSLVQTGLISPTQDKPVTVTQETGLGVLPVTCFADGKVMMTQKAPAFGGVLSDRSDVANLLGLEMQMLADLPIQVVSTGVKKLMVPVSDLSALRAIKPDLSAIINHGREHDYSGVEAFTSESFTDAGDFATRNFSPSVGIDEDPATGIAAGPLACYADKHIFDGQKKSLVVEQGFDMAKASIIYVDITNEVLVGGYGASFGSSVLKV